MIVAIQDFDGGGKSMPNTDQYKYCDVVMKGGITSGIIYPRAVAELAKEFRFKNVGGTSAGAIAAVITAAAEYGRRSGTKDSFSIVASLPDQLGSNGLLLKLFRPSTRTARIFATGIAILNAKGMWAKFYAAAKTLVGRFWVVAILVVAMTMLLLPALGVFMCRGTITPYVVLGILWFLFWGVVVACYFALRCSLDDIASNKFGLCTGFDINSAPGEPPLTNWLHYQIQSAAGRSETDPPPPICD